MNLLQPFEINRFAFEGHAGRHLARNFAPADFPLARFRQRPPAVDDVEVTHAGRMLQAQPG